MNERVDAALAYLVDRFTGMEAMHLSIEPVEGKFGLYKIDELVCKASGYVRSLEEALDFVSKEVCSSDFDFMRDELSDQYTPDEIDQILAELPRAFEAKVRERTEEEWKSRREYWADDRAGGDGGA